MKNLFNLQTGSLLIILSILLSSCCSEKCCDECPPKTDCPSTILYGDKYIPGVVYSDVATGKHGVIQTNSGANMRYSALFLYENDPNLDVIYNDSVWFKVNEQNGVQFAVKLVTLDPRISTNNLDTIFTGIVKPTFDFHGFPGEAHPEESHKKFHLSNIGNIAVNGQYPVELQELNEDGSPLGSPGQYFMSQTLKTKVDNEGYLNKDVYIFANSSSQILDVDRCHEHGGIVIKCAH